MNPRDVTRQADAELHPPKKKSEKENVKKKNLRREQRCLADRLPVIHHT